MFCSVNFFFRTRIRILLWNLIPRSYALYITDTYQSFRKVYVKIQILIRIRILIYISIPELHLIHRRCPPNCVSICHLLQKLLSSRKKRADRRADRQTDGIIIFCFFCQLYNFFIYLSKEEIFLILTNTIFSLFLHTSYPWR